MERWSRALAALRPFSLFRQQALEAEIDEELRFHLEMRARDNQAVGMPPARALAEAHRRFGNVARLKEECLWVQENHPLRTGVRLGGMVLTLTFGIGAALSVFLIVNAVWFRLPLTFHDHRPWVAVWWQHEETGQMSSSSSLADFLDWRTHTDVFDHLTLARYDLFSLTGDGEPAQVRGKLVSAGYFSRHGVTPYAGRVFAPHEEEYEAQPVVVLNYAFWQKRYGGAIDILGRTITLDGAPYTVVGIMPNDFRMYYPTDLFLPLRFDGGDRQQARRYLVAGRLKRGVTTEAARQALETRLQPLRIREPATYGPWRVALRPVQNVYADPVQHPVFLALGVALLLFFIACVHVFRAQARLGFARHPAATTGTGIGLVLAGGLAGLWVATQAVPQLLNPILGTRADIFDVRLDARVLGLALALTALLCLVMGLIPRLAKRSPHEGRFRKMLIGLEVALAFIFLLCAGHAVRHAITPASLDPGFEPDGVFTMTVALPRDTYASPREQTAFFAEAFKQIDQVRGVEAASLTSRLPGNGEPRAVFFRTEEQGPDRRPWSAYATTVGVDYFEMLGIPSLRGRSFAELEKPIRHPVVVINEVLAQRYWPGSDPIGDHLKLSGFNATVEIAGVVGNVRELGLDAPPVPTLYLLYWQTGGPSMTLTIRTQEEATAGRVRDAVRTLDANAALGPVITAADPLKQDTARQYNKAWFFVLLAGGALWLAVASVYHFVSDAVRTRRREIGIRRIYGASAGRVLGIVLGDAARIISIGLGLGLILAWLLIAYVAPPYLDAYLIDPMTWGCVTLLLTLTTLAACTVPAYQAARLNPLPTLRCA